MDTSKRAFLPRIRLVEARTSRKLSQQEVADRIGTTHVNVSRWERGITKPNPYFRNKLCRLFGKSAQELDLETVPEAMVPFSAAAAAPSKPAARGALHDSAIPLQPAIPLVGRGDELTRIRQRLLRRGSVALTALNGLPGVGKTALAVALAHDQEIRQHFRDGVLWAALGPHPNIPGLLSRWGALLGIPATAMATLSGSETWAKALHTAIGDRSIFLVIDDAWQLEEALTFKVGGSNCAHLVTTRFPNIATHIAFGGGATTVQELNEEESMALLRLLAPGVVDLELKKAHDLVQAVGGLPLALTLMGNYLRKQAYSRQPRRIHAALERLSDAEARLQLSEPHGPVESHSSLSIDTPMSLQLVIAVSDQQLNESARDALYALSVFPPKPNSFSEDAALAVASCSLDTLDTLSDAGLLESSSAGRYTLHQTIADYALVHLQGDAAHDRLIAHIIGYIEAHKKDYELLELESNIILVALEVAHDLGRQAELLRAVTAFAPVLLVRGLYQLAEQHLQRAHKAALLLGDHYGITSALLYLGEIAQKQGSYTQAEARFQEGLVLARKIEDKERISALLNDLGWVTWRRGEYAQAEIYLQEGLALARQIGHRERISSILKTLGSIAAGRGEYAQAEAYLQEGLILVRQIGDREQTCALLINLGATAGEQGNYIQAEEYFQEGLIVARQIGHREQICVLLLNLGGIADALENYTQAEGYFQEGLVLARQIGHREWMGALLVSLGLTARKQGNYTKVEAYLQEGLTLARQIGRPYITSTALYEYGNLYLNQQQLEAARATFYEMLNTVPEGGQDLTALAQYGLARVAAAQGNPQEAQKLGQMSITTLEAIGHRNAGEVRRWLNLIMGRDRDAKFE